MTPQTIARGIWECYRTTLGAAGGEVPRFEDLTTATQTWWAEGAVPVLRGAHTESEEDAYAALRVAGFPSTVPFAVSEVQPWSQLPRPTQLAWAAAYAVANVLPGCTLRTLQIFA